MDLKSKISDRNNMAFYFCLRDFLSAIFMYHSVVTNSYSSSKPIIYYNRNLNQEFIDILFDGKFPHLDTLFLMGFQN